MANETNGEAAESTNGDPNRIPGSSSEREDATRNGPAGTAP